jgi:glutaconate CoA-transferase subunit B
MTAKQIEHTPEEMMIIAASRMFRNAATCFVGVGQPGLAACLARQLHAPNVVLICESGVIDPKPATPPLSIADPELADTAAFIVSVPEIFSYWLQGGRVDMGFLGAAQIDRFGNVNSTVIGDYSSPKIRLPGGGGAPQIAEHVREIVVIVRHTPKVFVPRVDFVTTVRPPGRLTVVTDLGVLESANPMGELLLTSRHPGVTVDQIQDATAWQLAIAEPLVETVAPTEEEIALLRKLVNHRDGEVQIAGSRHSEAAR